MTITLEMSQEHAVQVLLALRKAERSAPDLESEHLCREVADSLRQCLLALDHPTEAEKKAAYEATPKKVARGNSPRSGI